MRLETVEEMPRCRAIVGVNLEPSIDKRADQPGPHRALVVCRIAGAQVAEIARLVIGLDRRKGAQPDRRQQLLSYRGDDPLPTLLVEDRVFERDREDLVRSERVVVAILAIDNVVEIAAGRMPEAVIERSARLVRMGREFVC